MSVSKDFFEMCISVIAGVMALVLILLIPFLLVGILGLLVRMLGISEWATIASSSYLVVVITPFLIGVLFGATILHLWGRN